MKHWIIITSVMLSGCFGFMGQAADLPSRITTANVAQNGQLPYYWKSENVGATARLLTLFCHHCDNGPGVDSDVPLIAVLRDTLGDNSTENNRVSYVWLLTYSRPTPGKRLLSAVPFFYWRAGAGSSKPGQRDIKPFLNVTLPEHSGISSAGRELLQWTMLDPMSMSIRASTRAYQSNEIAHERLHLTEAISYLRSAPVDEGTDSLTHNELNTVVARLELRQKLIGGFVNERRAAQLGEQAAVEQERIRARNWELLRQCADKTGLVFEPIDIAGAKGEYAVLWAPRERAAQSTGTSLSSVWKLLNIKDPYRAGVLPSSIKFYARNVDGSGSLLPIGSAGSRAIELAPLGVYSLNYPKQPLLLINFRNAGQLRRHELSQRAVNELTSGIIGISHFANWYYYAGADLYGFYASRHGKAMNQAARLDCYSRFRVALALDHNLDPAFRSDMQKRVNSLSVNPLEASPQNELQAARARYSILCDSLQTGGPVQSMLDKDRRAEVARFGESKSRLAWDNIYHYASFGLYTHRAPSGPDVLAEVDIYRRVQFNLDLLDRLANGGTAPEVSFQTSRIKSAIAELSSLMPAIQVPSVRERAEQTLARLGTLSQDAELKEEYQLAIDSIQHPGDRLGTQTAGVALTPSVALQSHP